MKIQQIILLEMRILFHRKSPIFLLLIGIPVVYSILFGCAYRSNVIKYVPAIIYDQDQTSSSRALKQAYIDSEKYNVIAEVSTQEEMLQYLKENKALVSIAIPPDFAKNIKLNIASEILIETNSTNVMFANSVISSSQEIISTFSAATGQKLLEAINQMPSEAIKTAVPVKLGVRIINNPTTSYTNFMLAGLGANGLQIAILLFAGTSLAKEYSQLNRWHNISSTTLVIGKILPYWLCSIVAFAAYIAVIINYFSVPLRGDIGSILLLGSAFCFLVINLSFFFSAISHNEVGALQTPLLYIMPGLLYSGLSWPQFSMNSFASTFSTIMPLTYMVDTLRDLLLAGYSPTFLKNTLIMFAAGSLLCLISILIFSLRRKKILAKEVKEVLV